MAPLGRTLRKQNVVATRKIRFPGLVRWLTFKITFQNDEIEALSAIYENEWCVVDAAARVFCIRIDDDKDHPKWTICLQVVLPNEYPATAPPIYQLNAPWLRGQERVNISNSLEEIYIDNIGESILYLWVEKIRDVLIRKSQLEEPGPVVEKKTEEEDDDYEDDLFLEYDPEKLYRTFDYDFSEHQPEIEELPPVDHGIPITDRRSTFQAHLAPVVCPKQDCEDDGETAAGGRLLHLLENGLFCSKILNVRNVMVVVSRWYGGILLGPDRFKHINNCARNILLEKNYISSPEESSKGLGKNKKAKKDKKKSEN
ncbi:protein IMPACT [Octodon degus]|uniref:Protein IMPACT n=1 Tax=Octodon degus TaxID=10160 RepID=A0A6P6EV06_OCTDE|nr:protein IMPACT [Octodon degus]